MANVTISSLQDLIDFGNGNYGYGTSSDYLEVNLTTDLDFEDLTDNEQLYIWDGCRCRSNDNCWYVNFHGNNHKIDNIYHASTTYFAFFSSAFFSGSVRDLKLTNMSISTSGSAAPFVFATDYSGSNNIILENCHSSGYIACAGTAFGFYCQGNLNDNTGRATLTACSFSGVLRGSNVSALGSYSQAGSMLQINSCMVYANLFAVNGNITIYSRAANAVNCEYRGNCQATGNIIISDGFSYLINCFAILENNSSCASLAASGAAYFNVYYDSTALDAAGIQPPRKKGLYGATTEDLKSASWLYNHGFAC